MMQLSHVKQSVNNHVIRFSLRNSTIIKVNKIMKAIMITLIVFYAGSISIPVYSMKANYGNSCDGYNRIDYRIDGIECYADYCFRGLRIKECTHADEPNYKYSLGAVGEV